MVAAFKTARARVPVLLRVVPRRLIEFSGLRYYKNTISKLIWFSFFARGAVLDFEGSRFCVKRLPMRGTSGSVRRSPANPARPGREQRYRDHFVCRGVPEVPLI
jgi:hypothetical protein